MAWKRALLQNNYEIALLQLELDEMLTRTSHNIYLERVTNNMISILKLKIERLQIENDRLTECNTGGMSCDTPL